MVLEDQIFGFDVTMNDATLGQTCLKFTLLSPLRSWYIRMQVFFSV
jgi:hypothetical protein